MRTPTRRLVALAAAAAIATGLAACGDDDEIAAEHQAYCDAATAIDENDGPPTDEMMAASYETAPDEIRPLVESMRQAFEDHDGNFDTLFQDVDFLNTLDEVELWEADHCGPAHADPQLVSPQNAEG